jgi:hypothetical protein
MRRKASPTSFSWDAEFTRRLFTELNRDLLWSLGDGNIFILSDSDEEEEAREEVTTDAEAAPPSVVNSPSQLSPLATLMMHPMGARW